MTKFLCALTVFACVLTMASEVEAASKYKKKKPTRNYKQECLKSNPDATRDELKKCIKQKRRE